MKFQIKPSSEEVKQMYENHSTYHEGDCGLDLFVVNDLVIPAGETRGVDLGISSQLKDIVVGWWATTESYTSYYMYPRSSISKTPLRLANSVGIIDSGYTGQLIAVLHNTNPKLPDKIVDNQLVPDTSNDFTIKKGERYVQLTLPNLGAVEFELVDSLRETSRGNKGFGSTNFTDFKKLFKHD